MDPISQSLLGAAAAQSVYQRKLGGAKVWLLGMMAGEAADLDIVIRSSDNPMLFFYFHRHFTHALVFIPIAAIILTAFVCLFFKNLRPIAASVFAVCLTAYATHGILDCFTSYGTLWLWPFTMKRIAFDWVSIIDPIYTLILLMGVLFAAVNESTRPAITALILSCAYLGYGSYQHHKAWQQMEDYAKHHHHQISRARVMPGLGTLYEWRALYEEPNQHLHLIKISQWPMQSVKITPGPTFPRYTEQQLPKAIQQNSTWLRDFRTFYWFVDGYLVKFNDQPLKLIDMRYLIEFQPPTALWAIEFPSDPSVKHVYFRRGVIRQQLSKASTS